MLLSAWQAGKELVLQPDFKTSDKKFRGKQLIASAVITEDRLVNERAVRLGKSCGYIKNRLRKCRYEIHQ